jgi:hypothetical protein
MSQVVIDNPIINSPFEEPTRHFKFDDEGITNEQVEGRRISSYFVPIARPRKSAGGAKQEVFDTEWTQDRIEENKLVNGTMRKVLGTSPCSVEAQRFALPVESRTAAPEPIADYTHTESSALWNLCWRVVLPGRLVMPVVSNFS